jgi:type I restriction enzyme S subunit
VSAVLEEAPRTLPASWHWTTMSEIADVVGGGTPRTNDPTNYEGGDVPWITPADLSGYTEKHISHGARFITRKGLESSSARLLPAGTVLFTSRAPIGYVAIARNPVATNQGFKSFVLKDGVLPEYVYWWLKGSKQRAEALASGTTFLELSGANAKRIPIPLAPLEQQRRIVAEIEKQFSRLDEAVANLKRVKANLKRYKAAVLKAAVEGRLVPTEAELARREGRSYETATQLLQRILETRRRQWKGKGKYKEPTPPDTADLPALPEGWVWATVESLSMKVSDGVHKKPNYVADGVPFVTVKNLTTSNGISFGDLNFVSPEDHAEFCKRTHPERGDILITKDGTLGVVRLIETDRPFSLFVSVALVKPVLRESGKYLVNAFESPVVQRQMVPKGSGLQHIHLEDLRVDGIPLPPMPEQQRIVVEVDRHLSVIGEVEIQIDANLKRAERLRQSVLSRAFASGLGEEAGRPLKAAQG